VIRRYRRDQHLRTLCRENGLSLDAAPNRDGVEVLADVFRARTYATGFPFHEPARILDVGAHKGYFSLFAARHAAPGAVIHAYEPSPANFAVMEANLARNGVTNVQAHRAAVAATAGRGRLVEKASANHEVRLDEAGDVPVVAFAEAVATLPGGAADFAKLDCEGGEYAILLDSPDEVLRRVRAFAVEFHDTKTAARSGEALRRRFLALGFQVRQFGYALTRQDLNYGMLVVSQEA
jgi:FkbM family methyltransferase